MLWQLSLEPTSFQGRGSSGIWPKPSGEVGEVDFMNIIATRSALRTHEGERQLEAWNGLLAFLLTSCLFCLLPVLSLESSLCREKSV